MDWRKKIKNLAQRASQEQVCVIWLEPPEDNPVKVGSSKQQPEPEYAHKVVGWFGPGDKQQLEDAITAALSEDLKSMSGVVVDSHREPETRERRDIPKQNFTQPAEENEPYPAHEESRYPPEPEPDEPGAVLGQEDPHESSEPEREEGQNQGEAFLCEAPPMGRRQDYSDSAVRNVRAELYRQYLRAHDSRHPDRRAIWQEVIELFEGRVA